MLVGSGDFILGEEISRHVTRHAILSCVSWESRHMKMEGSTDYPCPPPVEM